MLFHQRQRENKLKLHKDSESSRVENIEDIPMRAFAAIYAKCDCNRTKGHSNKSYGEESRQTFNWSTSFIAFRLAEQSAMNLRFTFKSNRSVLATAIQTALVHRTYAPLISARQARWFFRMSWSDTKQRLTSCNVSCSCTHNSLEDSAVQPDTTTRWAEKRENRTPLVYDSKADLTPLVS